ncbi:hypothetical protein [Microvirga subterranea]|uniref:Uncharacterized protein n=1 Tax=Microvirga subterranea TaxID=186651 RepID=A0A370HNL7_9HYPH|nr:hypothetical protein [Microvirga subterranea]RDI60166.1 hypothetical protein DES45_103427 [Microvirga subterranea]
MSQYTGPKINPRKGSDRAAIAICLLSLSIGVVAGFAAGDFVLFAIAYPLAGVILFVAYALVRRRFGWPQLRWSQLEIIFFFFPF